MTDERPQYFDNHLTPLEVDAASLSESLQELRVAVRNGADLIHKNDPIPTKWLPGGMFKHFPGTKTTYLAHKLLAQPILKLQGARAG